MPAHAFLSYSHANKSCATQLQKILKDGGLTVWRDVSDIQIGDHFSNVIPTAIKSVGCLILLLSRNSEVSENVKAEFEIARDHEVPTLPLLIDANSPADLHDEWWKEQLRGIRCEVALGCNLDGISGKLIQAVKAHAYRRCPVIGVFHMKGGVGKTIMAAQLAARLNVFYKKNVLIIDLDPQQNLTDYLLLVNQLENNLKLHNSVIGLFEPIKVGCQASLFDDFACDSAPANGPNFFVRPQRLHNGLLDKVLFDCIPGDMRSIKYTNQNQHEVSVLKNNFFSVLMEYRKKYDYIILDCNPSVSFQTGVALTACDNILMPMKPDSFAYSGMQFTETVLKRFFQRASHIADGRLKIAGFFNTVGDTAAEKTVMEEIVEKFSFGTCLKTRIPDSRLMNMRNVSGLRAQPNEPLANAIIRSVRNGRAAKPLKELVHEYVDLLEGHNAVERAHIANLEEGEGSEESVFA